MNKKKTARSVQDDMPLADIRGKYAYLKDGSYRAYISVPGSNNSLSNSAQRTQKALAEAEVYSAIKVPFSILKYPVPASSSKQLVLIDAAIERERKDMFSAKSDLHERACRIKADLLEEHLRPQAESEAVGSERVNWPTWLVLCFDAKTPEIEAERTLDTLFTYAANLLEDPLTYANEAQIRKLCRLYFDPSALVNIDPPIYTEIPLPKL